MKVTTVFVVTLTVFVWTAYNGGVSLAQSRSTGALISADTGIYLPSGDATQGRKAFIELRCNTCHRVVGEGIERLVEGNLGPDLGKVQAMQSKEQLATSIIAPSHNVASIDKKWRPGDVSRMGDFNQALTVRQWIDIVAYLKSLKK